MRTSTPAPAPRWNDRERTRQLIVGVFAVGVIAFGYGFAVMVRLLPVGWGAVAVFQYILVVIGALLASLMAIVAVLRWHRKPTQPLTSRQLVVSSLLASLFSTGTTIGTWGVRTGESVLPQFLVWTGLGLAVLSLQLPLGTLRPARRRRVVLLAESAVVFVVIFGFLIIDREAVNLASYTFVSGGAVVLLLLFGGPLILLGNRLAGASR